MRCHFVAQLYLKNFEYHDSKMVWVYDKKDFSIRLQNIVVTAVETDSYVNHDDATLEKIFSVDIENHVKEIIDKWISAPESFAMTSESDMQKAMLYIAFQSTRVPRSIDAVKEIMSVGIEKFLEEMKSNSENPEIMKQQYAEYVSYNQAKGELQILSFQKFCEMHKDPKKDVTIEPNEKRALAESLDTTPIIADEIQKLNKTIYISKSNHFFVSNDAPVNIFVQVNDHEAIFGGGIGQKNVEVSFPLSPKLCIFMSRKRMPGFQYVGYQEVNEINRRTVAMANRFVYSAYKSNRILRLIRNSSAQYGRKLMDDNILKSQFKDKSNVKKIF